MPPYRQMFYQLCDLNVEEYVLEGREAEAWVGLWEGVGAANLPGHSSLRRFIPISLPLSHSVSQAGCGLVTWLSPSEPTRTPETSNLVVRYRGGRRGAAAGGWKLTHPAHGVGTPPSVPLRVGEHSPGPRDPACSHSTSPLGAQRCFSKHSPSATLRTGLLAGSRPGTLCAPQLPWPPQVAEDHSPQRRGRGDLHRAGRVVPAQDQRRPA